MKIVSHTDGILVHENLPVVIPQRSLLARNSEGVVGEGVVAWWAEEDLRVEGRDAPLPGHVHRGLNVVTGQLSLLLWSGWSTHVDGLLNVVAVEV